MNEEKRRGTGTGREGRGSKGYAPTFATTAGASGGAATGLSVGEGGTG